MQTKRKTSLDWDYYLWAYFYELQSFSIPSLSAPFDHCRLILEFLIYVIRKFIEAEIKLIIEGLKADYENIMKPVHTIKNFINKLKGKEEEPKKEPTKERAILDKILSKKKAETTRENLQKQTDAKSKFSLWMQDKLDIFTKKKKVDELENLETERIPAPVEEELAIEVTPPWEPEND